MPRTRFKTTRTFDGDNRAKRVEARNPLETPATRVASFSFGPVMACLLMPLLPPLLFLDFGET
jgi:hypothetical protein